MIGHSANTAALLPDEKEHIDCQIIATDRQIDVLVSELSGLTGEEIRVVEGEGKNVHV